MFKPDKIGVHTSHCCVIHGCKYNDPECPVVLGIIDQEYPCEMCNEDEKNISNVYLLALLNVIHDMVAEHDFGVNDGECKKLFKQYFKIAKEQFATISWEDRLDMMKTELMLIKDNMKYDPNVHKIGEPVTISCFHDGCDKVINAKVVNNSLGYVEINGDILDTRNQVWYCEEHKKYGER